MRPTDDPILELLRDKGNMTPSAVEQFDICSRSHASRRLSALTDNGFVERIAPGLYGITDTGHAYLDETLEPDADADTDE